MNVRLNRESLARAEGETRDPGDILAQSAAAGSASASGPSGASAAAADPTTWRANWIAEHPEFSTEPDALLIAYCAQFDELERAVRELEPDGCPTIGENGPDDPNDRAFLEMYAAQETIIDQLCELRATTLLGLRTRAKTLTLWAPDLCRNECWDDLMLGALLRDLVDPAARPVDVLSGAINHSKVDT